MIEKNLSALQENLQEKTYVLEQSAGLVKQMLLLLADPDVTVERLEASMDELEVLAEQMDALCEEFGCIFEELKKNLPDDRPAYQKQIDRILEMNANTDELAQRIAKDLAENKEKMQEYLSEERRNLGVGRKSSKAALNYYKNMSGSNVVPSFFMDHKQ